MLGGNQAMNNEDFQDWQERSNSQNLQRAKRNDKAYSQGYATGYRARPQDNPYSPDTDEYDAWSMGVRDAKEETI